MFVEETLSFPGLGLEFNIKNVIQFGNLTLHWYGIIIGIGFVLALLFAFSQSKKFGIHPDKMLDAVIVSTIGGFIGARLYYVIFAWDTYKDNLADIFKVWKGGLAIYGGIIAAFLIGIISCRVLKIRFLAMADLASMGFLIGQSIGRWGNFVNIEAYGGNTDLPWGMTSEKIVRELAAKAAEGYPVNPALNVHPTFFYESLWCAVGFVVLLLLMKHRKYDGELFLVYIGWYGLGRFFIEGLRTDSLMWGPVRVSQMVALLSVITAAVLLVFMRIKVKKMRAEDPGWCMLFVDTDLSKEQIASYEKEQRDDITDYLKKKEKKNDAAAETEKEEPAGEHEDSEAAADAAGESSSDAVSEEEAPADEAGVLPEENK